MDGAGVGALVVGPEAVGTVERDVLNVPYLLASAASGERPVEGIGCSSGASREVVSMGASSSSVCVGT